MVPTLRIRVEPVPEESNNSRPQEEDYSDTADDFGGFFTKSELAENNIHEAPTATPTVVPESEADFKARAIRAHLRTPYPKFEITRIVDHPDGSSSVNGRGISKDQFGNDKIRDFSQSYSKWETEAALRKLKASESDHGVIFHE